MPPDAAAKPVQTPSGENEHPNAASPIPGNESPAGTGLLNAVPGAIPGQLGVPLPTGADRPRYIATSRIAVTWSEKNDAVWGFSVTRGTWTKQEVTPPAPVPLQPIVGDSVAALQVGSTVYAYSADTGRWDRLDLPPELKPQPMVDSDLVVILGGANVYTFANAPGAGLPLKGSLVAREMR